MKSLTITDIVYALSDGIQDIYAANVDTRKVTLYRKDGKCVSELNGVVLDRLYDEVIEAYINETVIEEDRAPMRAYMNLDDVCAELYDKDRFIYHYRRSDTDEDRQHSYVKCVRIGDGEDITDVVFAFTPENSDINRETLLNTIEMDDLTYIYTRQAFYFYAAKMIKENPDREFDITVADIANFKLVNSLYGEAVGDEVLKHVALYFTKNTTKQGVIGRYGGDRFVGFDFAAKNRNRDWLLGLIDGVREGAPIPNILLKVGVYSNVDKSISVSQMCDRALMALKSIKNNYIYPYATYDGPVSKAHIKAQIFESQFEQGIKADEFVIWYQPKHDAVTEKVIGVEALVRWIMSDGTFVSPVEFIPVFEEDGLIVQLDEYIFRKVCNYIKRDYDKGLNVMPVSVNLSRGSLRADDTVEKYKKIIEECNIPKEYVPIELTESAAIHSLDIRTRMQELKDAGFTLHMDDFGAGESSLVSLNILPFDVVKLDKSLIEQLGDAGGNEIVRHTIELAHFKKMKVVAEGVEEEEQCRKLKEYHCDELQGYYYSKPMPYEKLFEYLMKQEKRC